MECKWPAMKAGGDLREGEVHVWCANLEPAAEQLAALEEVLSGVEVSRAERFRFWRHRRRYIAGRGILRVLTGHYLNKSPATVKFSYSKYKKPHLPGSNIQFNLSHSKETALYAFCLTADIGIDLEKIRPIDDAEGIAARFFAPSEYARFQSLPVEEKNKAFFSCWTRKEAFIKAVGEGMSFPLADFDVSFSPGNKPKINSILGSTIEAQKWSLYSLAPLLDFAAALAVKGRGWQNYCRYFRPLT